MESNSLPNVLHPGDLDSQNEARRWRRSIYDNEIPEHPDQDIPLPPSYNVPRTDPGILEGRGESTRRKGSHSRIIPYPTEKSERKQKNKSRDRKHKNRRKDSRRPRGQHHKVETDSGFPDDSWSSDRDSHRLRPAKDRKETSRGRRMCSKRTLVIDFADIGWNEWIISPKSFEANYCAGSCPFPRAQVSLRLLKKVFNSFN